MPHPFQIFSQLDYLIQIIDINSHTEWQTVQIQISWLLQKPTDLDLHCLQRQGISGFSRTRDNMIVDSSTCVSILSSVAVIFLCLQHWKVDGSILLLLFIPSHMIVVGYYGFRLDVRVSVHLSVSHMSMRISFPDGNLSKHQWIFIKFGLCIDIVEIWFGNADGQISSNFDSYLPKTRPYFHFWW